MQAVEPNIQALATAQSLLLDPWGLTQSDLTRALGEIFTHKVDYADLYFQYTRSEGWSLEEGIVKTGSFSIEQGVGVRAISGEKTAFAYSDSLSQDALLSSARAVRAVSICDRPASPDRLASSAGACATVRPQDLCFVRLPSPKSAEEIDCDSCPPA